MKWRLWIFFIGSLAYALTGIHCADGATSSGGLAATPPMGWNDWAQYQCSYDYKTILKNAKALVATGLAADGYRRVTIDDCWMAKRRNTAGELVPNSARFPNGLEPVIRAVHAMGLSFGIYEDAGSETCGGFAGSGSNAAGAKPFFDVDVKLFSRLGVDYLKLDACNVIIPANMSKEDAYRVAYKGASDAIHNIDPKIIFMESAPSHFRDDPEFYDVVHWARAFGQVWRQGTDIQIYNPADPSKSRFRSVLWNYMYTLPLGRFQAPEHWNNPDFIIGGAPGLSLGETRSQMALWAMMSAPLVLSDDVTKLSTAAIGVLGNKKIIAIDQDALGEMATLLRRTPSRDVLLKRLAGGDYAVAVLNHSYANIKVAVSAADLGFAPDASCLLRVQNLWSGAVLGAERMIEGTLEPGDTAIWRITPSESCGVAKRTGAIVMTVPGFHSIEEYGQCLDEKGYVRPCDGATSELWAVTRTGALRANGRCLSAGHGRPEMLPCAGRADQRWEYEWSGELRNAATRSCLAVQRQPLRWHARKNFMQWQLSACGATPDATQVWSLPNPT